MWVSSGWSQRGISSRCAARQLHVSYSYMFVCGSLRLESDRHLKQVRCVGAAKEPYREQKRLIESKRGLLKGATNTFTVNYRYLPLLGLSRAKEAS